MLFWSLSSFAAAWCRSPVYPGSSAEEKYSCGLNSWGILSIIWHNEVLNVQFASVWLSAWTWPHSFAASQHSLPSSSVQKALSTVWSVSLLIQLRWPLFDTQVCKHLWYRRVLSPQTSIVSYADRSISLSLTECVRCGEKKLKSTLGPIVLTTYRMFIGHDWSHIHSIPRHSELWYVNVRRKSYVEDIHILFCNKDASCVHTCTERFTGWTG